MPHIRFRACSEEAVAQMSRLAPELGTLVNTAPDNFTFEAVQTAYFDSGLRVRGEPFVEVLWFPRSAELKSKTAQFLELKLRAIVPCQFVTVVFFDLQPESYFENGKHF